MLESIEFFLFLVLKIFFVAGTCRSIFAQSMTTINARYTSPTHSLNVTRRITSSEDSLKASLEATRQAVLATQTDLNVFLTERKLEEDRANNVNSTSTKRKNPDEEDEQEDGEEDNEE